MSSNLQFENYLHQENIGDAENTFPLAQDSFFTTVHFLIPVEEWEQYMNICKYMNLSPTPFNYTLAVSGCQLGAL